MNNKENKQPIAFVYQESPISTPNYKVYNGDNQESSEDLAALAHIIRDYRDQIKFLTQAEINDRYSMESSLIRPFSDKEMGQILLG